LKILKELEELVWITRHVGVGLRDENQWSAPRMATASLRKMLKDESLSMIGSLMKLLANFGAQKPRLSLLASDQICKSASSAAHSSASNSQTPSR